MTIREQTKAELDRLASKLDALAALPALDVTQETVNELKSVFRQMDVLNRAMDAYYKIEQLHKHFNVDQQE